ncbi:MAG: hydrolase CocE/NonD family protein [Geminicoccaceae bacterium]|nr:hydrolase CocE/NonD family protein [Geminicoccaceae bacterium]
MPSIARYARRAVVAIVAAGFAPGIGAVALAQPTAQRDSALVARRDSLERELQRIAVVERKLMVPMRDGARMQFDVYRPKEAAGPVPAIFVRTPYNMNFWDVQLRAPADMSAQLEAVKRGYAYVGANERGHFFSEGNYDILGPPVTDGVDEIEWISSRPWSNGKVGLIGCSSTAEWQMAVAAHGPRGLGTIIPQGFGAGVGRVKPYYEQGNWYRGGAVQQLFISWLYGQQNQVRPMFPPNTSQDDLIRAARSYDLAQRLPSVDWAKAFWHLPTQDLIKAVDGPRGIFADSMPGIATGGAMIKRTPNDSAWYRGGLFHDDMKINVPGLWIMTWYDVSVGPNLATYNHVRRTADSAVANQQYAVIAPTLHCAQRRATENTVVGERSVGDARYDYDALTYGWFDHFLKGKDSGLLDTMPKVRYFTMGSNKWQTSDTWPPRGAQPMTFYLSSNGTANTRNGDGVLTTRPPTRDRPDTFSYDPKNPVPSRGGNVCCQGNAVSGGAFDQQEIELRPDVLVYTTEPLKEGLEVSGPIDVTIYLSSDRKDTDVTVKVLDVYPDGRAYNLDETIQRVRYREGYDKPPTWMEPGKVYKVQLQPMTTSNWFAPGHRIRIEVSSSNFPRFDRNLNTGGKNYDEVTGLVAKNSIHHSRQYPSQITVSVVKKPPAM